MSAPILAASKFLRDLFAICLAVRIDWGLMAETERKMRQAIEEAVQKADAVLVDAAGGDAEMLHHLTAEVAKRFLHKATKLLAANLQARKR